MVTVLSDEPMAAIRSDLSNAEPKAGYDLTIALLVLDANDTGHGEFTPAAKIKCATMARSRRRTRPRRRSG